MIKRVSRKSPCVVCGYADYCGIADDRTFAICMRIKSSHMTKNGGWKHPLDYTTPLSVSLSQKQGIKIVPCASLTQVPSNEINNLPTLKSIDDKHRIYSDLLKSLVLYPIHKDNLLRRGLSENFIKENQYRSVPISNSTDLDGNGIAGFYFQNNWKLAFRGQGTIIPVRDEYERIQALQIRHDAEIPRYVWFSSPYKPQGTSSGAPVHYSKIYSIESHAYITEGALKADIISARLNYPVIGIAGVSTFTENFGSELKSKIAGLQRLTICFDSDFMTKPQVKGALLRLIKVLEHGGLKVGVRTWTPQWKGYDDYLTRKQNETRNISRGA